MHRGTTGPKLGLNKNDSALLVAAEKLLSIVEAEWNRDIKCAPAWFAPEGERIRDRAVYFLEAVKTGTENLLLDNSTLHDYLGAAWLDCHGKAYDSATNVQDVLASKNAAS